jgi:hypothetical protein
MRGIVALLLLALAAIAPAVTHAQSSSPAIASADKTMMERDRAVSRRLSDADRARAQKLFADGFALGQKADLDRARTGFEEGLAIDPANAPANYFLGYILLQQHEADAARTRFARTVYFAPKSREGVAAKAALAKLTAAEARSPLRADMTGACRPLVESFTAAAQKNDGPATKAAYEALHDAGGCGIANDPPVSAAAAPPRGAPPSARPAPGTSPAAMAATYARLVALGLQVAQEIASATQPASAGSAAPPPATAAPPAAAAPKASNQAAAASNPFASSNNAFAAKTSAPETSALGSAPTPASVQITVPPMSDRCRGLMQNLVTAAKANDGPGAKASYDSLQQAGGCGVVPASGASAPAPQADPRFVSRGDTPMIDQTFGACDQQPERCNEIADQLKEGTSPAAVAALYANAIGIGLQLGAEMAQGVAAAQQLNAPRSMPMPSARQTDMRSLAAPPIRNGVGQGAPTYTYRPQQNSNSDITGTH